MKKILLITSDFYPNFGGVANYYENLCKYFPGKDLIVLTDKTNHPEKFDQEQSYKIIRKTFLTKLPVWPKWLFLIGKVSQIVKKEKVEMIHVGQVLPIGTIAYILYKWKGIPYGVYTHGLDVLMAQQTVRKKKLLIKILNNAQWITSNSEYTKNEIMKLGISQKKIYVLYPGVSIVDDIQESEFLEFKSNLGIENKKIILSLGRIVERKGFGDVLNVLPNIVKKFPDVVYVIAGQGDYKKELINQLEELENLHLGIKEHLIWIDEVDEQKKKLLFKSCDIFVMPSFIKSEYDVEGFGIVYLEAGAFGKPCIAARSGGVPEAVLDQETGILIDSRDIKKLEESLVELLSNKEKRLELGENAQKRVFKFFQWEDLVKKWTFKI